MGHFEGDIVFFVNFPNRTTEFILATHVVSGCNFHRKETTKYSTKAQVIGYGTTQVLERVAVGQWGTGWARRKVEAAMPDRPSSFRSAMKAENE